MSKFKVDDVVNVQDKAWSRNLSINSSRRVSRMCGDRIRSFRILGVDCKVPVEHDKTANTLIQALDNLCFYAINDCNLSLEPVIGIQYIANGRNVTAELSDQSKDAILRAHLKD